MFNLDFSVHVLSGGDHRAPLYDWQSWMPLKYIKLISKWTIPLIFLSEQFI